MTTDPNTLPVGTVLEVQHLDGTWARMFHQPDGRWSCAGGLRAVTHVLAPDEDWRHTPDDPRYACQTHLCGLCAGCKAAGVTDQLTGLTARLAAVQRVLAEYDADPGTPAAPYTRERALRERLDAALTNDETQAEGTPQRTTPADQLAQVENTREGLRAARVLGDAQDTRRG